MSNPKELYEQLIVDRKPYEDRAENIASVTVPFLFPSESANSNTDITDSYGMRYTGILINSLASNIALSLLPPSGSSFRLDPDAEGMEQITQGDTNARAQIMALLGQQQIRINKEIENQAIRPVMHNFLMGMIACQPVVVEKVKNKGIRWHNLRNFAVKLDNMGEPYQLVIKETIPPINLPEDIASQYEDEEEVELYTMCVRDSKQWTVTQSVDSDEVGEESTYALDELPYTYLGWFLQSGDLYHRPFSELHYGLIQDYENMNRVSVQGSIISAKTIVLVNPLGSTTKEDIADSANGDVVDGREEDLGTFKSGKNYDYQISLSKEDKYIQMLDRAYMSRQGTQRDAERVTAEEIRENAEELDKDKAGIYSILSAKFTKWLIRHIMRELNIKFDAVDVNVIAGLDALGRSIETRKLDGFMTRLGSLQLTRWVKEPEIISRYAAHEGIDTVNLIKTPDEMQQEIQQAQQQALQQELLSNGAQSAGQEAGKTLTQQGD